MDIQIREIEMKDVTEIIECWNENLTYDLIDEQRFTQLILLDDNFDTELFQVAVLKETIIGFCFGIKRKIPYLERGLESERGWINMMAVSKKYRRQGVGSLLLDKVEILLRQKGTREITLCAYSPNYFTPGIDKRYKEAISFFEKKNYIYSVDAVSMQRDLWDFKLSKETKNQINILKEEGISIVPYHKNYLLQLLDFLLKEFGSGWKRNALVAMQKNEAEDTILLCVDENDEILGFCMRKIDGNDARFGPFGVKESIRSKGLGGILFEVMMHKMKAQGIPYLYFLWTGGAGQRFYERHQVKVYRDYRLYRKGI